MTNPDQTVPMIPMDDVAFEAAVERLAHWMAQYGAYEGYHPENLRGHAGRALAVALGLKPLMGESA